MKHTIFFLHLSGQKIIDNEFCSLYTDCGGDKNEYIGRTTQLCAETKGSGSGIYQHHAYGLVVLAYVQQIHGAMSHIKITACNTGP